MTVQQIYDGSNGDATKALYEKLSALGPVGVIGLNLFRAQKCSSRAKEYRKGAWKREAYDRKDWSLGLLDAALRDHGDGLGITWGWKQDPKQPFHCWVLYCDTPAGQCSFHTENRKSDRDYLGDWDGSGASAERILAWVSFLVGESASLPVKASPGPPVCECGASDELAEALTLDLDMGFARKVRENSA